MTALLLAAAMLQAPPNLVRLYCEIPPRIVRREQDRARLLITLDVEGDRIESALVDGPPMFSSYRRVRARRGAGGDAAAQRQLLPRGAQWRGHFQSHAIRLRRDGGDVVLEPAAGGNGAYTGFWSYVRVVENRRLEVNGSISCRPHGGTWSEGAPS